MDKQIYTPTYVASKLKEIHTAYAGNAVNEMRAEELKLVLGFVEALSRREVSFPSQVSQILFTGLNYLVRR